MIIQIALGIVLGFFIVVALPYVIFLISFIVAELLKAIFNKKDLK